ncbi:hypothetical protein PILCRDRAFT_826381, partial [Piloderma croceum F 1598]
IAASQPRVADVSDNQFKRYVSEIPKCMCNEVIRTDACALIYGLGDRPTWNAKRREAHGYSLDNQPFVMIHVNAALHEWNDVSLRTCVDHIASASCEHV